MHNFLSSVFSQGLHKVVRFLIMVLVIQQTGTEVWGQLVLAMTWIGYMLVCTDFGDGILASVLRPNDTQTESQLLQITFWKHLILGVSSSGAFALVAINSANPLWDVLSLYSLILVFKGLSPEWVFIRNEQSGILNIFLTIRSSLQLCALWIFREHLNVSNLVLLEIAAELIWVIMSFFIWPSKARRVISFPKLSIFKYYALLGMPIFFMNIAVQLHANADVFILNWFTDKATVGLYSSIYRVATFYYLVGGALSVIFRTRGAALFHAQQNKAVTRLMQLCIKVLFVLSILYIMLSMTILKPLLVRLFHIPEIQNLFVVEILSLYILAAFASVIFVEYFVAAHRRKELLLIAVAGGLSNVFFNMLLVPHWQTTGAALSTVLAELVMLTWLLLRRSLHCDICWHWPTAIKAFMIVLSMLSLNWIPLHYGWRFGIGAFFFVVFLRSGWISLAELRIFSKSQADQISILET